MTQSCPGTFSCHKTIDYSKMCDDEEEGDGHRIPSKDELHCAGALIYAEKHDNQTQMMRVMGKVGGYNPDKLMTKENTDLVWDSLDEWLERGAD